MWLSLFLFVWCCLCWTKTRNWSLERPKSKVKKPRDCKASLTPSSSGLSSTTTWKFYCYFPQARSKEIWDFSCNIYSKKDVCGYVFMKFWGHFTQNCWGQIYINVCCILWFHWHIYVCVQRKDFFYIESTSLVTNWENIKPTYLAWIGRLYVEENSLHTPVNLKLIQFLSSVLLIFNQSWSLKLEMYKLH